MIHFRLLFHQLAHSFHSPRITSLSNFTLPSTAPSLIPSKKKIKKIPNSSHLAHILHTISPNKARLNTLKKIDHSKWPLEVIVLLTFFLSLPYNLKPSVCCEINEEAKALSQGNRNFFMASTLSGSLTILKRL